MRWIERLLDRKTKISEHVQAAKAWDTCAVGEVVQDFPSVVLIDPLHIDKPSRLHRPADVKLNSLGIKFAVAVGKNDRKGALEIYDAIQARVRTLIRKRAA